MEGMEVSLKGKVKIGSQGAAISLLEDSHIGMLKMRKLMRLREGVSPRKEISVKAKTTKIGREGVAMSWSGENLVICRRFEF